MRYTTPYTRASKNKKIELRVDAHLKFEFGVHGQSFDCHYSNFLPDV